MHTWGDQFNGISPEMLFTPGGVFVGISVALIVLTWRALHIYTAKTIDNWIDNERRT